MKNSNYNPRDFLKDRTIIVHRLESEKIPGTLEIIQDGTGEIITEEKLEHLKKFHREVLVIDICTTGNKELFT